MFPLASAGRAAAALCLLSAAAVGAPAHTAVLLLHLDEGRGQWALDASGAENNGILGVRAAADPADPAWTADGRSGAALRFDGRQTLVVPHSDSLRFVRGIIADVWVRQTRRSKFARVLDKGPCFDLYIHENGTPSFRFHGAEADGVRGRKPIPLNQWTHLRAEYDGRRLRLFVNGELAAARAYSKPVPNRINDLRIGSAEHGRYFIGLIDEVRIVNLGYRPPKAEPLQVDADTVGLWRFDEADVARDAGPRHLDGEIRGAKLVPGKIGGALLFDGRACVRIPHHPALDLSDELTIECWVKQTARSPYARIVEKDNWTYGLWIGAPGRADFFYTPAPKGYCHTVSPDALPLHRWTFVRVEFDGVDRVMYWNGKRVVRRDVKPDQAFIAVSDGDLFIGNRKAGDRGFVGMIDEVRLSRVARTPRPAVRVRVTPFPSRGVWRAAFAARPLRRRGGALRWTLKSEADGRVLRQGELRAPRGGRGFAEIDVADAPPGPYVATAAALDADGKLLGAGEARLAKPPLPPWLGARIGVTNRVLPPWTPLKVESSAAGLVVRCWGREHAFRSSPWPTQISSAGADLLAGPMRFVVVENGRPAPATESRVRVASARPNIVRLRGAQTVGSVRARVDAAIEFDGMMRFDVDVQPADPAKVDAAYFEIPLAARHATLMHYPSGKWFRDPTSAGAVPAQGWARPNTWYLWVGDEDRGLCWFAEDQAEWGLDPKKPGIKLVRDAGALRLRFYLANAPGRLAARRYTWGLMATPVKPMPKGWRRWRFGNPAAPVTIGVRWSTLRTSKWHSFPVPPDPAAYRADIARTHRAGKKFIPYTNFNMQSDTGPDWAYWSEEWRAYAGEGRAADVLAMNVVNIRCCAMTPSWCDFIVWKYQRFLQEYRADGFYLDNSSPGRCNNPAHPASHHGRRHIFAARALMKRIYAVTKQADPRHVMVCHMSTTLCIPVLSFCDAIVDGEQYGWRLKDKFDGHYMPITPPARVRAELMGRQWGLVEFFLPCNRGPNPWSPALTRELLALMLPHGARFWLGGTRATMVKVLDAVDAFGLDRARFAPYWSSPPRRRLAEERRLLVTLYVRPDRALVLASNLEPRAQTLELRLDLAALGCDAPAARCADPLDHQPASWDGATLRCRIGPRDLRVVVIQRR